MRTTLEIEDDVLLAAKELAALRQSTVGKVLSELARIALAPIRQPMTKRNGVPLLPPRPDARPVTAERVASLLDEV